MFTYYKHASKTMRARTEPDMDGFVDMRECIDTEYCGGLCYAHMVNPDYTVERLFYDDYDYQGCDARLGEPKIDASKETIGHVRARHVIGNTPWFDMNVRYKNAKIGDEIVVVKGRKYPKGTIITIADVVTFKYASYDTGTKYIIGTNGEKVQASNCIVIFTHD